MKNIQFIEVGNDSTLKANFDGFIGELYRNGSTRYILGHDPVSNFLHGKYLGRYNDQTVVRFALYDNPKLLYQGKQVLIIGSFESIDDPGMMNELVEFIRAEAQNLGKEYLIGPMEGSTWENYRFSLSNENPPFFSEPFHHIYYNRLFEIGGFKPIAQYISQLDQQMQMDENVIRKQENKYIDMGATFRHLDQNDLENDLRQIGLFCNKAFRDNFLFTPIDPSYFAAKYAQLSQFMDPNLVWVVEDDKQQIHAVSLCLPDHLNKDARGFVYKTMARDPESPFKGIGRHLAGKSYLTAERKGYEQAIHAFMIDENASISVSDQYSGSVYKTYQLYGQQV